MTEYKECTHEEAMKLSKEAFIERCKAWIAEFNNNELLKLDDPSKCPVHAWVEYNHANCGKNLVSNTANCPICGEACCPDCMNHHAAQISRVTGYLSTVESFNEGKKQEFRDRQRFDIGAINA